MRKTLIAFSLLLTIFSLSTPAHAGECEKITDVNDYYVKVVSGVNIRDKVCNGNVIGTLSAGTVVKVTGEIEDWRHIELPDGGVGFIWSDFVEKSAEPLSSAPLYDIEEHDYAQAIRYLAEKDVVQGYSDGSFKPDLTINRAEFTKILIGAKLGTAPGAPSANCFPDVPKDEWFAPYVCYAKEQGIIGGYPNGTFQPAGTINLVEAAKILVNTMNVDIPDASDSPWYRPYIYAMQAKGFIPSSFSVLDQPVTRAQMSEMAWRIMENLTSRPAKAFDIPDFTVSDNELEVRASNQACHDDMPASVDMVEVRKAWMEWHNDARRSRGLTGLLPHEGLDYSASLWAKSNKSDGSITHTRPSGKSVSIWFEEDAEIEFKLISGTLYGENLGWGTYSCALPDCTQQLVVAIRNIFDAFMAEEGTSYTGHYDNIVNKDFAVLGLGLTIDEAKGEFFLTSHYAAGVNKYPSDVCAE